MAPETHLLASWVVAAFGTNNRRDCRLVALAGLLPDADALGLLVDAAMHRTQYYARYHHYLLHGLFGGLIVAGALAIFARCRWRVALLAFAVFHLHLLCDLLGSRGPSAEDLWPLFYLGPFTQEPMWIWKGQWRLDGWQNRYFSAALFVWSLFLAVRFGHSFVGVFNQKLDNIFTGTLRQWHTRWLKWKTPDTMT